MQKNKNNSNTHLTEHIKEGDLSWVEELKHTAFGICYS